MGLLFSVLAVELCLGLLIYFLENAEEPGALAAREEVANWAEAGQEDSHFWNPSVGRQDDHRLP